MVAKKNRINQMEMADCGPEKAGVGGSIPSLATTFSITYGLPFASFVPFRSKIQFGFAGNLTQPGVDQMDSARYQCCGPREYIGSQLSWAT